MRLHCAFKILIPLHELRTKIEEFRTQTVMEKVRQTKHWMQSVEELTPSTLVTSFLESYLRDFDLDLFVFDYQGELYGVPRGADWMLSQLLHDGWAEDFSYTDSCDRPSNIKKKEWNHRSKVWEELIPYRVRVEECGYKIEVLSPRILLNVLRETNFLDELLSLKN